MEITPQTIAAHEKLGRIAYNILKAERYILAHAQQIETYQNGNSVIRTEMIGHNTGRLTIMTNVALKLKLSYERKLIELL